MIRRDDLLAYHRYEAARRALDVLNRGVLAESQESFRIVTLAYDLCEMRAIAFFPYDAVNHKPDFEEEDMKTARLIN